MKKTRIYITLEGGLVTNVWGKGLKSKTHEYVVCDYDCDGADDAVTVRQVGSAPTKAIVYHYECDDNETSVVTKSLNEIVDKDKEGVTK